LARPFDDQQKTYTNRVITLWYRPPELLLGAQIYGPAIDMWSVGCIFAELLLRKPILPGRNEPEQLDCICKLLGTPTEQTWPGVSKLVHYDMFMSGKAVYQNRFQDKFGGLDRVAQDLLQKLLSMDPTKRISAKEALDHDYFWTDPLPAKPENLPKHPSSHEFTAKKRRQQLHHQQQQQHAQPQQQQSAQPYGSYPYPTSHGMQRPQPQSYGGGGKRYRDGPTSYQERGAPPGAQHYMHQAQPPHHAQRYSSSARPPSAVPPGAHHLKGGVNPATGGAWPRSQ
jgi:cyclin-dependent kinase 12/13